MTDARHRWEARYAVAPDSEQRPSDLLTRHLSSLPRGRALDLACGSGRHAVALARAGFAVDAIDIAWSALVQLRALSEREQLPISPIQADLTSYALARERYAVVVNVRYLQRDLFAAIREALLPGGVVVFETFLREQAQLGHPRNPAFLLEPGELRRHFADFDILDAAEGLVERGDGRSYLAQLVARRPARR